MSRQSILSKAPKVIVRQVKVEGFYLIMEAGSKVMGHNKEVICSFCPIPKGPVWRDELYGTSHHPWRLEWQRQAIRCKVTSGIYRSIKPVCFLRIQSSNRAGEEEPMHEDLSSKHVVEASGVLLKDLLVVFAWELIHINFQLSNWIIFQYVTSTSCIILPI